MTKKQNADTQSTGKKRYCYDFPRPSVTVDVALFRRREDFIEVLLIKRAREPFKGKWAFPGGFVDKDESLEDAAARELKEETGLEGISMKQVGAFGDPGRDPRGHTVSIVFAAVVEGDLIAKAADDADDARWHSVERPPALAFDHKKILRLVLERIFDESHERGRSSKRKRNSS